MKKILKSWLIALVVGLLAGPQFVIKGYAAASGNYTDLLPIGAAGDTTVISNGSGWSLTTLAPSQTFGDALSRAPMTVFQTTGAAVNITNTTTVSTYTVIAGEGKVGSTTFPARWVAAGRSIRITARGRYTTTTGAQSWIWGLNIGTMTVFSSSTPVTASVSSQSFSLSGLVTISSTGAAGAVSSSFDIIATTGLPNLGNLALTSNVVSYSTSTTAPVTIDLNSQLTINPLFTWGMANQGNNIQFNNVLIEFLN